MKLFQRFRLAKKNQLKRHIFSYIVVILFCLLIVFLLLGNLDNIWMAMDQKDELPIDKRPEYQKVVQLVEQKKDSDIISSEKNIFIWGDKSTGFQMASQQMGNMKEEFQVAVNLEDCSTATILFICKNDFSDHEIALLTEYSESGITLFFTEIPGEQALDKKSVRDLLGIDKYKGVMKKKGMRLSQQVLFGSISESKQSFSMKSVSLKPQSEVYGSALESDKVKNENLSPIFWRHQQSSRSGSVYVAEEQLLSGTLGYGIISFFFTDLYQIYMYPIVNAYCFMVSGMPYVDNLSSDFLQSQYERDSLGIQNDIFFPQFKRCGERYGVKTTWYTKDQAKLENSTDALLQYYMRQLEDTKDEIGKWNPANSKQTVNSPFENQLEEWTPGFQWNPNESDTVSIPYRSIKKEKYENVLFHNMGFTKGLGFNSTFIDIPPFLQDQKSKSKEDWIEFCKNMETILGVEAEKLPWLERTTVGEAIYRIQALSVMEPHITYSDSEVNVTIDNFSGKAYFYLSLPKKITRVENASITKISDDFYMVGALEEKVKITYQDKDKEGE